MYKTKLLFKKLTEEQKEDIFCDTYSMLEDGAKHFINIKMSDVINDGHLSYEEAHDWVSSMTPYPSHWSIEETTSLIPPNTDINDWYAALNMAYSDFRDIMGTEDTSMYVKIAKGFIKDPDVKHPDKKIFTYYHRIVR